MPSDRRSTLSAQHLRSAGQARAIAKCGDRDLRGSAVSGVIKWGGEGGHENSVVMAVIVAGALGYVLFASRPLTTTLPVPSNITATVSTVGGISGQPGARYGDRK